MIFSGFLDIATFTVLWEVAKELLIATLEYVNFWVIELWVDVDIDLSVSIPHHRVHSWSPLLRMLTVEDDSCLLGKKVLDVF